MTAPSLTVFYNSACPVCKAGIDNQRTRMAQRDIRGQAEWIDVACNAQVLDPLGLNLEDVRHSLHVHDGHSMLIGADALIALAQVTPYQRWLALLFGNRAILPLSRFFYNRFASLLYWWNKKRGHW